MVRDAELTRRKGFLIKKEPEDESVDSGDEDAMRAYDRAWEGEELDETEGGVQGVEGADVEMDVDGGMDASAPRQSPGSSVSPPPANTSPSGAAHDWTAPQRDSSEEAMDLDDVLGGSVDDIVGQIAFGDNGGM